MNFVSKQIRLIYPDYVYTFKLCLQMINAEQIIEIQNTKGVMSVLTDYKEDFEKVKNTSLEGWDRL